MVLKSYEPRRFISKAHTVIKELKNLTNKSFHSDFYVSTCALDKSLFKEIKKKKQNHIKIHSRMYDERERMKEIHPWM